MTEAEYETDQRAMLDCLSHNAAAEIRADLMNDATIDHDDVDDMVARRMAGARPFNRLVFLTSDAVDLNVWIKPDTDLDSSFTAICDDTGETLRVNGWLFSEGDA